MRDMRSLIRLIGWMFAIMLFSAFGVSECCAQVHDTSICDIIKNPGRFHGLAVRLNVRVETTGHYLTFWDERCLNRGLILAEDGPTADTQSLKELGAAVERAYALNHNSNKQRSGHYSVFAIVMGTVSISDNGFLYLHPSSVKDIKVHLAKDFLHRYDRKY